MERILIMEKNENKRTTTAPKKNATSGKTRIIVERTFGVGDLLELKFGEKTIKVEVVSVADIVGKADAAAMYTEIRSQKRGAACAAPPFTVGHMGWKQVRALIPARAGRSPAREPP